MANHEVNTGRRRFLTATTAVVGAIGAGFAAVPFVSSFKPSARAKTAGAPVTVNISKIDNEPDMRIIQQWRGKPVWIFKRTPEQLADLAKSLDGAPASIRTRTISTRPRPSPNAKRAPSKARKTSRSSSASAPIWAARRASCRKWCRSRSIRNGRAASTARATNRASIWPAASIKGVPAPSNLEIPPYHFADDNTMIIGVAPEGAA